jgi:hypothetical protein
MEQKTFIAMVVLIVVILALAGIIWWVIALLQTTYPVVEPQHQQSTQPASRSISDGIITLHYDETYGLAVTPEQILNKSYIPACDPDFNYCLYYNGTQYQGTNFESAGLRVKKRQDLATESVCLNTPPEGFDSSIVPDKNTSTNAYSMSEFSNVGQGAAGHISQGSLYRLFVRNSSSCYEFETRVGMSQFANYPAGSIKEFTPQDQQNTLSQLLDILRKTTVAGSSGPITLPS